MASFRKLHNDVEFVVETLHHDLICSALLESRLDLGLAFDHVPVPGITEEVLALARFVVLTPKHVNFGSKRAVGIEDLANLPFIRLDSRGPLGRLLSAHIESSGVDLHTVAYSETYHIAKALVSYAMGVTITDEITANAPGHSNIRLWPFSPTLSFRISTLHFDSMPMSIVTQKFADHLRECVAEAMSRGQLEPVAV